MKEKIAEARKWYDELVEELESNGFCTRRECMCDTAAPVVKLGAAIAEMERECTPGTTSTGTPSSSS